MAVIITMTKSKLGEKKVCFIFSFYSIVKEIPGRTLDWELLTALSSATFWYSPGCLDLYCSHRLSPTTSMRNQQNAPQMYPQSLWWRRSLFPWDLVCVKLTINLTKKQVEWSETGDSSGSLRHQGFRLLPVASLKSPLHGSPRGPLEWPFQAYSPLNRRNQREEEATLLSFMCKSANLDIIPFTFKGQLSLSLVWVSQKVPLDTGRCRVWGLGTRSSLELQVLMVTKAEQLCPLHLVLIFSVFDCAMVLTSACVGERLFVCCL